MAEEKKLWWVEIHGYSIIWDMILCSLLKLYMLWRNLLPPPLLHSLNIHNSTDLQKMWLSVNIAVKCIVIKRLFWWALGHHDENVHGGTEWWKRACQLYM
jgi:hypothetical protein